MIRRSGADRGAASVFVIGFAVVLLACAGLVFDGGLAINARQRVADDAEQAARAGAEQIDVPRLRATGQVRLDPAKAQTAASAFLGSRGYPAADIQVASSADGMTVTAGATLQVKTALLSLVHIDTFTVSAHAQARPAVGIATEIANP